MWNCRRRVFSIEPAAVSTARLAPVPQEYPQPLQAITAGDPGYVLARDTGIAQQMFTRLARQYRELASLAISDLQTLPKI